MQAAAASTETMKTILLLRHAKSSRDNPDIADFDRPLSGRGRRDAPRVGEWMRKEGLQPDLVLCSAALRARETWEAAGAKLGGTAPVLFERALYMAGPTALLNRLRRLPDKVRSVLLVGHNPGLETLALALAAADGSPEVERMRAKFPTAALARLDLPLDRWHSLGPGAGRLTLFAAPGDLS
jgi:phosphohistidine phosphatase